MPLNKAQIVLTSIVVLAMRVSILSCKLGLAIFVGRYLDLSSLGIFGLCTGVVAVGPSLVGMGMVHVIMRDAVVLPLPQLTDQLRHYWSFIALMYTLALAAVILATRLLGGSDIWALVIAITLFEHFGNDIFQLLSNLQRPLLANASAFIRGAGWILLYVPLAIWQPALRSMPVLLGFWLAGSVIALLLFFWKSRSWPWLPAEREPVRPARIVATIRQGFVIYLSDLGFVASQYIDRYLVSFFLGLEMAGLYFLYWSAANAVNTFVSIAVLQVQRPILIKAHVQGGVQAHQKLVLPFLGTTVLSTIALSVATGVAFHLLLPFLRQPAAGDFLAAFWLIMAGMALRNVADFGAMALFTSRRDRIMTLSNVAAVAGLAVAQSVLLPLMGLNGAGTAMIATFGAITIWRGALLYDRAAKRAPAVNDAASARAETMPDSAAAVGPRSFPR
jgi:O-antigen/teichoic acid export membrane protein